MRRLLFKNIIVALAGLLLIGMAILADTWLRPAAYESYTSGLAHKVQSGLIAKEKETDQFLIRAARIPISKLKSSYSSLYDESRNMRIRFYITRLDGGMVYYSSNTVFPSHILTSPSDSELQKLPNGYYLQKNIISNGLVYIALVAVKYHYAIENQYLQNFIPFLKDNNDFNLVRNAGQGYAIYNTSHQYIFSLEPKKTVQPFNWIVYLFLGGLLMLSLASDSVISRLQKQGRALQATAVYLAWLSLFVLFWKYLRMPSDLYRWPVFSSHYYGSSSFFSSLGDLLFFSFLVYTLFRFLSGLKTGKRLHPVLAGMLLFLGMVASFIFSAQIVNLISSLILDSIIPFDFGNIFGLNFYSVVGICIVFIITGCYFLFLNILSRHLLRYAHHEAGFFIYAIISAAAAGIILWFTPLSFIIAFVFNAACLYVFYDKQKIFSQGKTVFTISLLAFASFFISIALSKTNEQKENDEQQNIASNIITERDPVAEYLFSNVYTDLRNDNFIKDFFRFQMVNEQTLDNRIQQLYMGGYFTKFDIDINTYTPDGLPFKDLSEKPLSFYTDLLDKEAAPEMPENLFYLHRHTGLPNYISKIPIESDGVTVGILLIQLQQKPFYEESVYPELLVSEDLRKFKALDEYSYAVYSNGILQNQRGEYPYPGRQNFTVKVDSNNVAGFKEGGYMHLVHQPHANLLVIVSRKSPGILYYVSSFAFIFLFMGVGFCLYLYVPAGLRLLRIMIKGRAYSFKNRFGFARLSFRSKILITVLSGMTISILLIGIITVSYIMYQYNRDEQDNLRKKTRQIATRLSNELQQNERQLVSVNRDIRQFVKTLSDNYQADINVFDVNGNLVISTQSAIYDKQIIAPKMDAAAMLGFTAGMASQIIQEERIGQLKFTSCYMPIRNSLGQVTGYLNLPYFSKEQELKDRISSFLEALVNLYLLLLIILVFIGIFITRVLTAPLNIIRNHLKNTSLSGSNEFITWNTNDEIGKLVKEYNTMILALKESAERLAQSEREDALKELAQHVAHEIKNPLTPMKLGIQQLQNAYFNNDPNYDALFKKVTSLFIRQIDTLSAIANDFNASARQGNVEHVNVRTLLQQICDLFSHNLSARIRLDMDTRREYKVLADPNKLSRVFTNLVNNGIQAVPEGREPVITIRTQTEENEIMIAVEDNGSGIPEAMQRKIFIPNFSTKSSGTGLGLAISKAIVEQAGGTIRFTTVLGQGSTFIVSLPLVSE